MNDLGKKLKQREELMNKVESIEKALEYHSTMKMILNIERKKTEKELDELCLNLRQDYSFYA